MATVTTTLEVVGEAPRALELLPLAYTLYGQPRPSMSEGLRRKSIAPLEKLPEPSESTEELTQAKPPLLSRWRACVIIGTVACLTLLTSMLSGLLVVSLPTMARELGLSDELLLWPASVTALACGCTLLIAGSIADVVGGRKIYLMGSLVLTITTVACGVCTSGIQLILFRAAQGIGMSLCIPSSVILITSNIPSGSRRNIAFACLGAGQPVGFSVGLVISGIFTDGIGWRFGYYIGAIVTFVVFVISVFSIPSDPVTEVQTLKSIFKRMGTEIDWIGCLLLSASLGLFSYVLAILASGVSRFISPVPIALLSIAVVLLPVFAFHTRRQERLGLKVIIPPSLWGNRVFTSLCITVFFTWGIFMGVQFFLTLFFQEVQTLSAIQTSLRFLPMVATGTGTNLITGWLVKKVRADMLVLVTACISAISPLLMGVIDPAWSYWYCAFFAVATIPVCADTLFTVANLLITSMFPPQTHGLAGGVFNTVSNIGYSVGLAITAVIASSVTLAARDSGETHIETLMDGYRVAFWFCFGANIVVLGVIMFGMRKIGKVGVKDD